ncbi:NAD(P)-dependent oxidoreductase [Aurantimonas sp. VKM B-3413]|uniref:NAD-dependent epimerase/dehydratase family protein n=1 Tax=Aurantimonas sp. VKM B-3413 TaxID=2779401 RepID=UPI001E2DAB4C|nr:NAD(P)-dependent oxidoreductase [Aurantimonas sp. VKM B-3413]MCB8836406.1 NAD(P)-dependent oxidoreductase [Aurantimonas sp. VKM B-3413]
MPVAQRDPGRILVTGAAGFLGSELMKRFKARGQTAVGADIVTHCEGVGPIVRLDVCDISAVNALVSEGSFATIVHCGAVAGPVFLADQPLTVWQVNTEGSVHLLEAARRAGVARVVLCSSIDVYGSAHRGMVDETARPDPDTIYGASKAAAEQALLGYRREHGLDALALRFARIYGPGRRTPTVLESLLRNALAGRGTVLDGHPRDPTHYLFIDDAVQAVVRAVSAARPASGIFNIATGKTASLARMVEIVRSVLPELDVTFGKSEWEENGPCGFDRRRAESELGFERLVLFDEGIRRYVDALRGTSSD